MRSFWVWPIAEADGEDLDAAHADLRQKTGMALQQCLTQPRTAEPANVIGSVEQPG